VERVNVSDLANSMKLYVDNFEVTVGSLSMPIEQLNKITLKSENQEQKQKFKQEQKRINCENSKKLREYRKTTNKTFEHMAEKLGVSVGTYKNYENNSCIIPVPKIKLMNKYFKLKLTVFEKHSIKK
jgi:DNA-binding XRE family transcriptional regulator